MQMGRPRMGMQLNHADLGRLAVRPHPPADVVEIHLAKMHSLLHRLPQLATPEAKQCPHCVEACARWEIAHRLSTRPRGTHVREMSKNSTVYIGQSKAKALVQYPSESVYNGTAAPTCGRWPTSRRRPELIPSNKPLSQKKTGGSVVGPAGLYAFSIVRPKPVIKRVWAALSGPDLTGSCGVAASQPDLPQGCPAAPHPEPEPPASPLASSDCPSRTACHRSDGSRRRARHRTMQT